ncbi:alpha-xenorhabdolysin family binary toxin subunit A [Pseudomonas putida]
MNEDVAAMVPDSSGLLFSESQGKTFEELSVTERAELIPQQLFDFKKAEPAFIFSKENLRTIKRYESAVLKLPVGREALAASLNFSAVGINIEDVEYFYDNLRLHVGSWNGLEDACKKMGAELQTFAESLLAEGGSFINELKMTEAWQSSSALTIAELEQEGLPSVPLSGKDAETFKDGVDHYLLDIRNDVVEKLAAVRHVKKLADHFGSAITTHLKPMADNLVRTIASREVVAEVADIEMQLVQIDKDVESKSQEYNGLVGSAFYGLLFGPIGLLVTGGIYGSKAEVVRGEMNKLVALRRELVEKKYAITKQTANFDIIKMTTDDLRFRLVEVSAAARNLEDVWLLLETYAEQSLAKMEGINTNLMLKKFVRQFERVIRPWISILDISKDISRLFNEEIQEF